jgi:membrane protein DedA with SNARE-associated domain
MIPIISEIVKFISNYPISSSFLSGFLTEELLIILAFLSGPGKIPLYIILTIGTLGIIASDILWFLFFKSKPLYKISKKISNTRKKATSKTKLHKLPPPTRLRAFIFLKFFYGIRTWAIFYNSTHKTSLKKFIKMTTIATTIYVLILATLAKILGDGIYLFFKTTKHLGKTGILLLIILSILIILFSEIYERLKNYNKKNF